MALRQALRSLVQRLKHDAACGHHGENALRLVHLHIPKCAGVSLLECFKRAFRESHLHLEWQRAAQHWKEQSSNDRHWNFVTGHISFEEFFYSRDILLQPYSTLTVIREPLDRVVSEYNYCCTAHPGSPMFREDFPDVNKYLRACLEQRSNFQTWYSAGVVASESELRWRCERFAYGICAFEQIEEMSSLVQRAFGQTPEPLDKLNTRQEHESNLQGVSIEDVDHALAQAFRAANQLDYRLYDGLREAWR